MPMPDADFDWCAEYAELSAVYRRVVRGESVAMVRYRNLEEEREVRYSATNISLLRDAMREARDKCAAANGETVRRRCAIVAVPKGY